MRLQAGLLLDLPRRRIGQGGSCADRVVWDAAQWLRRVLKNLKWTSLEIVDTRMASIELSEGVPWVIIDIAPSLRMRLPAR
jgi:hypothetical protein